MAKNKEVQYLEAAFKEFNTIYKDHATPDNIKEWKAKVLPKLVGTAKTKVSRVEVVKFPESSYDFSMDKNEHEKKIIEAVLRDSAFKHYVDKKSKDNIEILKLLKAREENIDFEMELAEMVCGDNDKFPYRSSFYLTEFFQNLGYSYTHSGETRKYWVKDILEELNIKEIYTLITTGLFRKKYFIDFAKEKDINMNDFFREAAKEFKEFVQNSITANEAFDLSSVLDMNVNVELLFDNEAKTSDIELNKLIEEAKERFFNPNDKQIAIEKLWDAFERLRTHFDSDKKKSASKLVEIVADKFDSEFINEEFLKLGKIGNNYRIRHHETNKKELTPVHLNYFFFRMLSLIDLCLVFLKEEEIEEVDLF